MPKACKAKKASKAKKTVIKLDKEEHFQKVVKLYHGELPEDKTCAICLEECTDITTLHKVQSPMWMRPEIHHTNKACPHVFCQKCIHSWVDRRKYTCPMCRTGFNSMTNVGKEVTNSCTVFNIVDIMYDLLQNRSDREQFLEDAGTENFSMCAWDRLNHRHTVSKRIFNQYMEETGRPTRFKDVFPGMNTFMRDVRNKLYGELVEIA
jgi:hypothetical protein